MNINIFSVFVYRDRKFVFMTNRMKEKNLMARIEMAFKARIKKYYTEENIEISISQKN